MTDQTAPEHDPLVERIAAALYDDATTHTASQSWADAYPHHRTHFYLQAAAVIDALHLTVDRTGEGLLDGSSIRTHSVAGGWSEWIEAGR